MGTNHRCATKVLSEFVQGAPEEEDRDRTTWRLVLSHQLACLQVDEAIGNQALGQQVATAGVAWEDRARMDEDLSADLVEMHQDSPDRADNNNKGRSPHR